MKLLILGGGHSEIPLIIAAKKVGFEVHTAGVDPSGPGHRFSDVQLFVDYSRYEDIERVWLSNRYDNIQAGCNDFAALTASQIGENYGIPGHTSVASTQVLHDKGRFNEFCQQNDIPVPKSMLLESPDAIESSPLRYPLMIKPVNLTGGKGMSVVTNHSELSRAVAYAEGFTTQPIQGQEFITGSRHGIHCLVFAGEVIPILIDDEQYGSNPFLVKGASYPSLIVTDDLKRRIVEKIQLIRDLLDVSDGLLHLQLIIDSDKNFYFIDSCTRPPGDFYIRFSEVVTGVSTARFLSEIRARLPIMRPSPKPIGYWARECLMGDREGILLSNKPLHSGARVVESYALMKLGDFIEDESTQKSEIRILEFASSNALTRYVSSDHSRSDFIVA